MRKMRGFTLIELLIVVAIIAILAAIAVPNFLEAQVRSKVSRARTDMRSLATAIEAYFVDNNVYPAWGVGQGNPIGGCQTYNYWVVVSVKGPAGGNAGGAALPTFLLKGNTPGTSFMTLTTPQSYITTYPPDPFATNKGETFMFYGVWPGDTRNAPRGGVGWILWSYGPDVDEYKTNPGSSTPYGAYNPAVSQPSTNDPYLNIIGGLLCGTSPGNSKAYTYDPTNGTVSAGDIWRVKQ